MAEKDSVQDIWAELAAEIVSQDIESHVVKEEKKSEVWEDLSEQLQREDLVKLVKKEEDQRYSTSSVTQSPVIDPAIQSRNCMNGYVKPEMLPFLDVKSDMDLVDPELRLPPDAISLNLQESEYLLLEDASCTSIIKQEINACDDIIKLEADPKVKVEPSIKPEPEEETTYIAMDESDYKALKTEVKTLSMEESDPPPFLMAQDEVETLALIKPELDNSYDSLPELPCLKSDTEKKRMLSPKRKTKVAGSKGQGPSEGQGHSEGQGPCEDKSRSKEDLKSPKDKKSHNRSSSTEKSKSVKNARKSPEKKAGSPVRRSGVAGTGRKTRNSLDSVDVWTKETLGLNPVLSTQKVSASEDMDVDEEPQKSKKGDKDGEGKRTGRKRQRGKTASEEKKEVLYSRQQSTSGGMEKNEKTSEKSKGGGLKGKGKTQSKGKSPVKNEKKPETKRKVGRRQERKSYYEESDNEKDPWWDDSDSDSGSSNVNNKIGDMFQDSDLDTSDEELRKEDFRGPGAPDDLSSGSDIEDPSFHPEDEEVEKKKPASRRTTRKTVKVIKDAPLISRKYPVQIHDDGKKTYHCPYCEQNIPYKNANILISHINKKHPTVSKESHSNLLKVLFPQNIPSKIVKLPDGGTVNVDNLKASDFKVEHDNGKTAFICKICSSGFPYLSVNVLMGHIDSKHKNLGSEVKKKISDLLFECQSSVKSEPQPSSSKGSSNAKAVKKEASESEKSKDTPEPPKDGVILREGFLTDNVEQRFQCMFCQIPARYKSANVLMSHILAKHKVPPDVMKEVRNEIYEKPYKESLSKCSDKILVKKPEPQAPEVKPFVKKEYPLVEIQEDGKKKYRCKYCDSGMSYQTPNVLMTHITKKHPDLDDSEKKFLLQYIYKPELHNLDFKQYMADVQSGKIVENGKQSKTKRKKDESSDTGTSESDSEASYEPPPTRKGKSGKKTQKKRKVESDSDSSSAKSKKKAEKPRKKGRKQERESYSESEADDDNDVDYVPKSRKKRHRRR